MKEAKAREELVQAGPTHVSRNRISSRTVNAEHRDQCTSGVLGTQKGRQNHHVGMGASEERGTERRDSWYLARITLDRQHFYCFLVNMNKTM